MLFLAHSYLTRICKAAKQPRDFIAQLIHIFVELPRFEALLFQLWMSGLRPPWQRTVQLARRKQEHGSVFSANKESRVIVLTCDLINSATTVFFSALVASECTLVLVLSRFMASSNTRLI